MVEAQSRSRLGRSWPFLCRLVTICLRSRVSITTLPVSRRISSRKLTRSFPVVPNSMLSADLSVIRTGTTATLLALSLMLIVSFPFWMSYRTRHGKVALIPNSLWQNVSGILKLEHSESTYFLSTSIMGITNPERLARQCQIPFTSICLLVTLSWGALNSIELFSSLYFQEIQHHSSLTTSLLLLPMILVGTLANFSTGVFVDRLPARWLIAISSLLTAGTPLIMALVDPNLNYWYLRKSTLVALLLKWTGLLTLLTNGGYFFFCLFRILGTGSRTTQRRYSIHRRPDRRQRVVPGANSSPGWCCLQHCGPARPIPGHGSLPGGCAGGKRHGRRRGSWRQREPRRRHPDRRGQPTQGISRQLLDHIWLHDNLYGCCGRGPA